MWYTSGSNPRAFTNFVPAIPKTISCWILISWSPPYNVLVIPLYSSMFDSMSESIKYSFLLPISICHTFKFNSANGIFTDTIKSLSSLSLTGFIGNKSVSTSL